MQEVDTGASREDSGLSGLPEAGSTIQQEVQQIKEAVAGVVSESSLTDKVETLRASIENISEEVQKWRTWRKSTHVQALETLGTQVNEIQAEWASVSASMETQHERLESILQASPGIIEASALRALSLRVIHLEQLVSELFQESNARATVSRARKQFVISLVALGVTVVLWSIWIVLAFVR